MVRTVFTMGVYDCFHFGHLKILERAKKLGDVLIVGVVEDYAVTEQKGAGRPVIPFEQRVAIINGLRCVDYVFRLTRFNPLPAFIANPEINVYVKGEDQDHIDLTEVIKRYSPVVVMLERTKDISTTKIVKKLEESRNIVGGYQPTTPVSTLPPPSSSGVSEKVNKVIVDIGGL